MTPHDLPQNWQWVILKSIGKIITGSTPSKANQEFYGDDYPLFKPTDLEAGYYTQEAKDNVSLLGFQQGREIPAKSTLVTCIGATIGKTGFTRTKGICNQQINAIIPDTKQVIEEFVYFYCISPHLQSQIASSYHSTTLPILKKSLFEQLLIPLPPLEIQREIVEILESKLEKIKETKALLETSLQECEAYRLSLLESAFSGNLTPHSQNWQWVKLGECLEKTTTAKLDKDTFSYIDIESIDNKTQTITTPKTLLTSKAPSRAKREVKEGDTLFSMVRPYLKNIAFVDSNFSHCVASTGFYVCRPKPNILPKYLFFVMISPLVVNGLNHFMRGDNSPSIRSHDLEGFSIPLPPLEIQREIVEILESKLEKIKEAKALLEKSLQECETYRLSLLESAFAGKLV